MKCGKTSNNQRNDLWFTSAGTDGLPPVGAGTRLSWKRNRDKLDVAPNRNDYPCDDNAIKLKYSSGTTSLTSNSLGRTVASSSWLRFVSPLSNMMGLR